MYRKLLLIVISLLILISYIRLVNSKYLKIESDGKKTPKYDFVPLNPHVENMTIHIRQQRADVRLMFSVDSAPIYPYVEIRMEGYDNRLNQILRDGDTKMTNMIPYLPEDRYHEIVIVRDATRFGIIDRGGFQNMIYDMKIHLPKYEFFGVSAGVQGSATFMIDAKYVYNGEDLA